MWTTLRSAGSSTPSTSWWFGLCWQSARRWPCSCGNTGRRPWQRPWWPASCTRLWPTSPPRANWWMIFFRIWRTIPGESQKDQGPECLKMWMMVVVCMCPAQGIWPVGLWTAGSVLQTRRAGGHEVADVRAEELEQLHVSEAGRRCQASWLHRSHLQPDAADWHVDGLPEDGEEQQSEGDQWHNESSDTKLYLKLSQPIFVACYRSFLYRVDEHCGYSPFAGNEALQAFLWFYGCGDSCYLELVHYSFSRYQQLSRDRKLKPVLNDQSGTRTVCLLEGETASDHWNYWLDKLTVLIWSLLCADVKGTRK